MESMKKVFAVLMLNQKLLVNGQEAKLPKDQFVIPVFLDRNKAEELAGDKFEVMEFYIPVNL